MYYPQITKYIGGAFMRRLSNFSKVFIISFVLVGCASRADSVAPISIPSSNYKGLSCADTKTAHTQAVAQRGALTESQNNAVTGDAIGVFFVLLPLGTVFGSDNEGALAQAKGEALALQGAVSINCNKKIAIETPVINPKESISVRLQKVKKLLADGLITQKEADRKKKEILDSM
jgi:hypothetical protein